MNQSHLAARVAHKLIQHVCRLHAGDFALLFGRRDQLDLLLRLEYHALTAGARAQMVIEDEERLRRLLRTGSLASAANERLSLLPSAQTATHVLRLSSAPFDLRGLPREALNAWNAANGTLQAALLLEQRAMLEVALPSRRLAQRLRQPFHPYNDAIWQALDCDYPLMEQQGQRLRAALGDGAPLRISDPRGAELTLRLAAGAPGHSEAGEGATLLPAGVYTVAVAEGTAEGEAIIDAAWLQGKPLRHVRLRFQQGCLAGVEGAGSAQVAAVLAANPGTGLLSQLSVGCNPAVTTLRPYPLGTETALLAHRRAGAIFLGLGNPQSGDGSGTAVPWNLGLAHAMLEVNGQGLLRSGAFIPV